MSEFVQSLYELTKKIELVNKIYSYTISCAPLAALAKPGQFVHIRVPGFTLRRPISISRISKDKKSVTLVFEVKGAGTEALSKLQEGDPVDLMGPLGKGFTLLPREKTALFVGGGIGVPPLLETASRYRAPQVVLGFRSREAVILEREFRELPCDLTVCTDDGSYGRAGLVTPAVEERLVAGGVDLICACGPKPMLRAVKDLAGRFGVSCQLSLEERMGCGVGACLVCACKGSDGQNRHVCKDGPVFDAKEVDLDD